MVCQIWRKGDLQLDEMSGHIYIFFLIALHCACAERKYVDMTHILDNATIRWPGHKPFVLTSVHKGPYGPVEWVALNNIESSEHVGTHMDSPYHFNKNGWRIHEIPFHRLHGPGVIINIERKTALNRDALVSEADLVNWEKRNGPIPVGAYVLMNSGWNKYWGDQERAVGSNTNASILHFPGFSEEAARWLAENRQISAVGSDTVSCDHGPALNFPAHVILLKKNVMCIENVASLDQLPESGVEIFAMPIKIRGTGVPIRMFAMWDTPEFPQTAGAPPVSSTCLITFLMTMISLYSFLAYF